MGERERGRERERERGKGRGRERRREREGERGREREREEEGDVRVCVCTCSLVPKSLPVFNEALIFEKRKTGSDLGTRLHVYRYACDVTYFIMSAVYIKTQICGPPSAIGYHSLVPATPSFSMM